MASVIREMLRDYYDYKLTLRAQAVGTSVEKEQ